MRERAGDATGGGKVINQPHRALIESRIVSPGEREPAHSKRFPKPGCRSFDGRLAADAVRDGARRFRLAKKSCASVPSKPDGYPGIIDSLGSLQTLVRMLLKSPTSSVGAEPRVRIHSAPPSSPSPFATRRETIEIRACAADFAQLVAAENGSSRGFAGLRLVLSAEMRFGVTTKMAESLDCLGNGRPGLAR